MYRQPHLNDSAIKVRYGRRWPRVSHQASMLYRVPAQVLPIIKARGATYLGEDEHYYYWMEPAATDQLGGFFDNIGNMFTRMVKFTPKSFTPGNIYKGFVNTSLTAMTGGLYQVLPKDIKKTVYEVGKVAIPVVAGGVLAVTAGPAVMATLMPKLSAAASLLGKAPLIGGLFGGSKPAAGGEYYGPPAPAAPGVDLGNVASKALTIGGEVINLLNKLPQNKQAEVVQQLTPEDIAYMEQYRQVPPRLRDYFDSMAQQTFNPPMASSGAQSLYDAYGPQPPPGKPDEASMFGGMDMQTILLFAVPLGFYLLTSRSGRR
jgi:hypothetical protein